MLGPAKRHVGFLLRRTQEELYSSNRAKRLKLEQRLCHFHSATQKRPADSVLVQHPFIRIANRQAISFEAVPLLPGQLEQATHYKKPASAEARAQLGPLPPAAAKQA
jgi:hypothetical protein